MEDETRVFLLPLSEDILDGSTLDQGKRRLDLLDLEHNCRIVDLNISQSSEDLSSFFEPSLLYEPPRRLGQLKDRCHEDDGEDHLESDGEPEGGLSGHEEEGEIELNGKR